MFIKQKSCILFQLRNVWNFKQIDKLEKKLWLINHQSYIKAEFLGADFLKSHRRKQILGVNISLNKKCSLTSQYGVRMRSDLTFEVKWGQFRSFCLKNLDFVWKISFWPQNDLKWPQRSDLTSSVPHIVRLRNIFY